MKEKKIVREILLPESVSASLEGQTVVVRGPQGEVRRDFRDPKIKIFLQGSIGGGSSESTAGGTVSSTTAGSKIMLESLRSTKTQKTVLNTFRAHLLNMVVGVQEPHRYKLKICSGHFPMNVAIIGPEFIIKNFLGENKPRKIPLPSGVAVKIEGNDILVSSPNLELAGQTAARIELLCRITNRDIRVFQDGCYIIEKAGKAIGG